MSTIVMTPWYHSGGKVGQRYVDVLPDHLTLDTSYVGARYLSRNRTLFRQVNFVPHQHAMTPDMYRLFTRPVASYRQSREELFRDLWTGLRDEIYCNWRPDHFHAIVHSSGFDSRMISWAIRSLHQEHGDDWLGDVLFLCSKWEGDEFVKIMRYEGWSPDQYWVVDGDRKPADYYTPTLTDFPNAWRQHQGYGAIPINITWYPVQRAASTGRIPSGIPVQTLTGQWGNFTMDYGNGPGGGGKIHKIWAKLYYSALSTRPCYGDVVHRPYLAMFLSDYTVRTSIRLGYGLRPALIEWIDPDLAAFTNVHADGDRHRRIADEVVAQMVRDYRSSWYGKHVAPDAEPQHKTTEFSEFWFRWTAASLCEHLLERGHKITCA